jgi:mono/diheme cytochrome c family protein/uncharacterized membrane protein
MWSVFMKTLDRRKVIAAFVMTLSLGGASEAQGPDPEELPSRVRSIFLAKCSECHGRSLSRPRAALYLNELGQLASHREWVVPFEPEQSYLWTLIRDDDMPAKGAKAGPLNAREKEIIRAWIAAGAPVPPPSTKSSEVPPSSTGASQEFVTPITPEPAYVLPSLPKRVFAFLGRFHILAIHFPIALLAAAAFVEAIAALRGSRIPSPTVRCCVFLGAIGAVAAVALGWLHADVGGFGGGSPSILALHRWLGTASGLCALAIVAASELDSRSCRRSKLFRIVLWVGAGVVAITAHFGGLMVHGQDFFVW